MKICCDTTFLIDLSKRRRKAETAYHELLSRKMKLHTTFLNVGELLAGIHSLPPDKRSESAADVWKMMGGFVILGIDRTRIRRVCVEYAGLHHHLASKGTDIPATDKVIIANSLAYDIRSFLTRDVDHYKRVPGINVVGY